MDTTIKLTDARAEMKEEKGSINQALKVLCTFLDTCPSVKEVVHSKAFALSCASDIYTAMGVGQTYQVTVTKKNEDGTETKEKVDRVRKPSADLCLRWFIKNQAANALIYAEFVKKNKKGNEENAEK